MRRTWLFRRPARARRAGPSVFQGRSGPRKGRSGPGQWSAIGGWSSRLSRILLCRFELLLGAAHFVDKFLEPGVIFFAGLRFQAAGDVNAVWTNDTNGVRDVLYLESAGQNDTAVRGGAAGEVPISGLSGAAILARASSIEKKGECVRVSIERAHREAGVDAKGFDDGQRAGDSRNDVGSFVAVELRRIKAHERAQRVDVRRPGVDEHADGFDFLGKLGADLRGVGGDHAAETFFVEVKAEGVGTGVRGGFGVGEIGDAANLDANHTRLALRGRRAEKIFERGGGIGCQHEMFADQEGVEAGSAQSNKIVVRAQAGFTYRDTMVGDAADQFM